jgi:hypothetical protein
VEGLWTFCSYLFTCKKIILTIEKIGKQEGGNPNGGILDFKVSNNGKNKKKINE